MTYAVKEVSSTNFSYRVWSGIEVKHHHPGSLLYGAKPIRRRGWAHSLKLENAAPALEESGSSRGNWPALSLFIQFHKLVCCFALIKLYLIIK